jgi:quercetin dioxygenase-like cupin family protein
MPLINLAETAEKILFEGYHGKIIHGESMTVAHIHVDANSSLPEHHHHNEQTLNMIMGEFLLTVDGVEHQLKAGVSFVIPPNVPHSAKSVTDCYIVDVFCPPREDWK